MSVSITHDFVSTVAQSSDATLVSKNEWNAEHNLSLASGKLIGRTSASTGAAQEITPSTDFVYGGTALTLAEPAIATVLAADATGTDGTSAQAVFPTNGTFAATSLTTYEFEAEYFITRSAGTTSHTTSILFGGTATFTSLDYIAQITNSTGNVLGTVKQIVGSSASAVVVTAANTSATENLLIKLRGHFRVNGVGTIIPQFQYSAAPGGAPTIKADSFFRMRALGVNTLSYLGSWETPAAPPDPIYSIGSMTAASMTLTLSDAAGGTDWTVGPDRRPFVIGDKVIVEIGGEAGAGARGTDGVGGAWTVTADGDYYHVEKAPKSLIANVTNVAGSVLTLDVAATVDTTNAKVYLDNTASLQAALTALASLGTLNFPAGEYVTIDYVGTGNRHFKGAGKGVSILRLPKGVGRHGLTASGNGAIVEDVTIHGNFLWEGFGRNSNDPTDTFYTGVGVWVFSTSNAIVRNVEVINVSKKAVWFEGGSDNLAQDCSMILEQPLRHYYAQWFFGASDADSITVQRCTFTCPYLSPGFEFFRSSGCQFLDCTSLNGSVSFNSSGDWLLENFTYTSTENSFVDEATYGHTTPVVDINSNISPPSPSISLGGTIRNINFTCGGITGGGPGALGNYLIGVSINSYNPNITIDGGTFTYPPLSTEATSSIGANAISCPDSGGSFHAPDNVHVNDVTVVGPGYSWFGAIHVDGEGASITNCTADWIYSNFNIYHNGVYAPTANITNWIAAVEGAGGTVTEARGKLINTVIYGLFVDGIYAKLDRLWLYAGENAASALLNIVTHIAWVYEAATNSGSTTFTTDRGFTGNGSNMYIDSGFNPTTASSPFYVQDSACIFGWTNTTGTDSGPLFGQPVDFKIEVFPEYTDNNCYWRINTNTNRSIANTGHARGLYTLNRTTANDVTLDINGVEVDVSAATASAAIANENLTALRGQGNYSTSQICCFGFGQELTATERENLYYRLRVYMNAVGVP